VGYLYEFVVEFPNILFNSILNEGRNLTHFHVKFFRISNGFQNGNPNNYTYKFHT